MSRIRLIQTEFESRLLANTRTVWIQQPAATDDSVATGVCIFLDGEYYLAHLRAARIIEQLQRSGRIPLLVSAYVSHIDYDHRWPESFCNATFAECLAEELLPWVSDEFGVDQPAERVLVGLSLTGLAAAHAALHCPGKFTRALCQSGSFWWNNNWLANNLADGHSTDTVFRIAVGRDETQENVDHGNGLFQRESQLAANRRMRDALLQRGIRVSYHEFPGGHSVASWREDLAASLTALFAIS